MSRGLGTLLAQTDTGDVVESGTVAYYEVNGSTPLGQAVYATEATVTPTTSHPTNGDGFLARYVDRPQRATFKVNGGSTAWPIDFLPDPGDMFVMGADGVTVCVAYEAVARARIERLEGRLLDDGGFHVNLETHADGETINDYAADGTGGDATAAFQGAHARLVELGGGTLDIGPGTFRYPSSLAFDDNIVWRGTKGKTVLMRPPESNAFINVLNGVGTPGFTNVGFEGITFDGNQPENIDLIYATSEVAFTGTDNFMIGCTIKNFNAFGLQCGGTRPIVAFNKILGPNDGEGAASYDNLHLYPNRYAGRDGIITPGNVVVKNALIMGNYVTGLRIVGILAGGPGLMVLNNHVENCHRSYGFLDDGVTETGGGQIATCNTSVTPGDGLQACTDFVIANNYIGPSATSFTGTNISPNANASKVDWANGIELNLCTDGLLQGNILADLPAFGISITNTQRIVISGGSIRGCGSYGLRVAPNTVKFSVVGVTIKDNLVGVHMSGTTDYYSIQGCLFEGNTSGDNITNTATGVHYKIQGNVVIDGDPVPEIVSVSSASDYALQALNFSTTGYGLRLLSGPTNSQFNILSTNTSGATLLQLLGNGQMTRNALAAGGFAETINNTSATGSGLQINAADTGAQYNSRFRNYQDNRALMDIFGTGQALHRSNSTDAVTIDITQAAAGLYAHLIGQRSTATLWAIGSDASDRFTLTNAARNAQNLTVTDAGQLLVRNGFTLSAGSLAISSGSISVTGGQIAFPAGLVGTPTLAFTGTATGIYSSGTDILDFASNGTNSHRIRADGLWDTRIAGASVALGGGATATMTGAIGGSGPASANIAVWKKEYIGGVATYFPGFR